MTRRADCIAFLLKNQSKLPVKSIGNAFAPSNIALIKYWGKRDAALNLPVTGSLSVSLGEKGAHTTIALHDHHTHTAFLNGNPLAQDSTFYQRLAAFLDWIKPDRALFYRVDTHSNLPIAAGLASSACGFAALVKAFADLYDWQLPDSTLSILCRLGSGSAARSLWQGFVEWHRGKEADGFDSFAEPLPYSMPDLRIGLCILSHGQKPISSREAMNRTTETSILYASWPKQVAHDLAEIKQALDNQDFEKMGEVAERNALAMHATMLASTPAICYFLPETLNLMQQVWQLRRDGISVYFTEDAGPNLKLLARKQDCIKIDSVINNIEWISV